MTDCACGVALGPMNKSGLCRACMMRRRNADPAWNAKRLKGLRESEAMRPGSPSRRQAALNGTKTRMANPEYVAWLRDFVRTHVQPLSSTPEAVARRDVKATGRKRSAKLRAWCPEGMWDEYQILIRSKGMRMADAKRVIIERYRRRIAELSPFERQMRALERGGKIVANDARPASNQVVRRVG